MKIFGMTPVPTHLIVTVAEIEIELQLDVPLELICFKPHTKNITSIKRSRPMLLKGTTDVDIVLCAPALCIVKFSFGLFCQSAKEHNNECVLYSQHAKC